MTHIASVGESMREPHRPNEIDEQQKREQAPQPQELQQQQERDRQAQTLDADEALRAKRTEQLKDKRDKEKISPTELGYELSKLNHKTVTEIQKDIARDDPVQQERARAERNRLDNERQAQRQQLVRERSTAPSQPERPPQPAPPLMVVDRNAKDARPVPLQEFVKELPPNTGGPERRKISEAEYLRNPNARIASGLQARAEHNARVALDRIGKDMEADKALNAEDVKKLSRTDVDGIRHKGDTYLHERVQQQQQLQHHSRRLDEGRGQ